MQSKEWFRQGASLSQILSASEQGKLYQRLAGTDKEISDAIAVLSYLRETGIIGEDIDFVIGLLNVLRMSAFATSPHTNEITKMGLQMPKGESVVRDYGE